MTEREKRVVRKAIALWFLAMTFMSIGMDIYPSVRAACSRVRAKVNHILVGADE
jgi:predicted thioredoxin/glutaredoxin